MEPGNFSGLALSLLGISQEEIRGMVRHKRAASKRCKLNANRTSQLVKLFANTLATRFFLWTNYHLSLLRISVFVIVFICGWESILVDHVVVYIIYGTNQRGWRRS